jgi:hypothetical protein
MLKCKFTENLNARLSLGTYFCVHRFFGSYLSFVEAIHIKLKINNDAGVSFKIYKARPKTDGCSYLPMLATRAAIETDARPRSSPTPKPVSLLTQPSADPETDKISV